jgi:(1->4)-alpha-D-glucan 1-alpha-D-glucosylmutase
VARALDPIPGNWFLADFAAFHRPVALMGMVNSLAQTLLKITAPGVPDFYQGTEVWDFSLVDPDNRRPVDFAARAALLDDLRARLAGGDHAALARELVARWEDGHIKLSTIHRALACRRGAPCSPSSPASSPRRRRMGRGYPSVARCGPRPMWCWPPA